MINCDVVIIDSGVTLGKTSLFQGINVEQAQDGYRYNNNLTDDFGHGSIIYSIISKEVNPSKIFIIKLYAELAELDDSSLIAALDYIVKNVKCKIINISLGVKTGENIAELYRICSKITYMGTIIVSAFDNEGCFSYPAAFDCVIGVDSKSDFRHSTEFDFVEKSRINIFAKGNIQRLRLDGGRTLLVGGSSIACAHITALLAKACLNSYDPQSVLSYLKSKSRYIFEPRQEENVMNTSPFKITNAVVFPFSKETQAFVRFADMLSFNIIDYYDVRYSGKVGRKISTYYEEAPSQKLIKDIDKIEFKDFDTIILGHLDEINDRTRHDYRTEIIKKAIASSVNIYSFDSLTKYYNILNKSKLKFFYPQVTSNELPQNTFGKLFKIPKPVVGIYGTSSQQGKFSLQLTLKKELEFHGYKVGTIGTEPHSPLFGIDVVFPMGYNSTVFLENSEIITFLNNEINRLCEKGKEIILVSTQAQIVPYCFNNLLEFPVMQYHFALGTSPDAIVVCINYHDELEYIRNSIYTLMGLTGAEVLAFVMYPITYASDWNGIYGNSKHVITKQAFQQKAEVLSKEFQIPVYLLGDKKQMSELCESIIRYF